MSYFNFPEGYGWMGHLQNTMILLKNQNTHIDIESWLVIINSGLCHIILLPFFVNRVPPGFWAFFKLESFSPAAAHGCANIEISNGGQPVWESCRYSVGKFLGRQIGELLGGWSIGECVGWIAQVFLHPGELEQQHCQGDQTHQSTLLFNALVISTEGREGCKRKNP